MAVELLVEAPRSVVWGVISDIPNAAKTIRGITKVEVLEQPADGLVGLKWRETRTMYGKEATEVIWITEASEPLYYDTRAESHGAVYTTRVALEKVGGGTRLSMEFASSPQTLAAKALSVVVGVVMKGSIRKALEQDLEDIKAAAQARA